MSEIDNMLLKAEIDSRTEPEEDRIILQPDGSRACLNWELRRGYSELDLENEPVKELSDRELLLDAERQLRQYKK